MTTLVGARRPAGQPFGKAHQRRNVQYFFVRAPQFNLDTTAAAKDAGLRLPRKNLIDSNEGNAEFSVAAAASVFVVIYSPLLSFFFVSRCLYPGLGIIPSNAHAEWKDPGRLLSVA